MHFLGLYSSADSDVYYEIVGKNLMISYKFEGWEFI